MDTLASSGVLFTNGYVPDNHCRPALQSLVTGILPYNYNQKRDSLKQEKKSEDFYLKMNAKSKDDWESNFDYHALQYFQTMPKELSKLGYKSFQSGKWWEYHYKYGGFTHGMTSGWVRENRDGRNWFQQFMGGEGTDIGRVTNEPVFDFIKENKSNPFFIWYAPQLPHYPFDAPNKYRELYLGKGYSKSAVEYYANCTWFDDSVGELFKFLKDHNLYDNTLFVYVNDNGWEQEPQQEFFDDPMRSHNGGDKGKLSIFDQSFRTPIIFSWKNKISPDTKVNSLIHSTDIPATILNFAGANKSKMNHGLSYKDVIEGKVQEHRNIIIGNSNKIRDDQDPMGRDVEAYWGRDKNWFYKSNLTDQTNALYNIIDDPFCTKNVINNNPDIVQKFANRIFQRYQKLTF
tara:strand:- start:3 stop:1208 length:1206 start_codon:yes stop_codon:yes gene_type:complete